VSGHHQRPAVGDKEVRLWSVRGVELRQAGSTLTLNGYASVIDAPYDLYGGPAVGGWSEIVVAGAFDKTLRENPDVQLLVNHTGLPLARTKSGTMRLSADQVGLKVAAELDPTDPDVAALRPKMARGDIDEMSFAFRVLRQEWDEDYTERRLLEISLHRGDVSVVNYGANPATSATLRALAELGQRNAADLVGELRREGCDDPTTLIDSAIAVLSGARKASPGARRRNAGTMDLSEARRQLERLGGGPGTAPGPSKTSTRSISLDEARAGLPR
jgi:HK97 family phage prohead protease